MGIGRSFAEAVQKACQSLENEVVGLGYYGSLMHTEGLLEYIKHRNGTAYSVLKMP